MYNTVSVMVFKAVIFKAVKYKDNRLMGATWRVEENDWSLVELKSIYNQSF